MTQAATRLAQMRVVGPAVLTETKFVGERHPKTAYGYSIIMCSKAVSGHQGGVALVWKEDNPKFEVGLVLLFNNDPNTVTFQLATGDERFYFIGTSPRVHQRGRRPTEGMGRVPAGVQADRSRGFEY